MATYSHSRLETFENCPLRYRFEYIDGIRRDTQGIEAFVGSLFHEVMEKLYKDLKCRVYALEELLAFYEDCWKKKYSPSVTITRKDRSPGDYQSLGRKFIEDYYRRYHPFDEGRVLALEKSITFDLDPDGGYKMRGFIDRVVQADDDTYEVHDYKTSGTLPGQAKLDSDRQLALYQLGLEQTWDDVKRVKLVWHYVAFDKQMISSRTRKQLESLKADTIRLIDGIEASRDFPPRESFLCDWCAYPDLCPRKKHLHAVSELPANQYLEEGGVKLVNEFTRLKTDKAKFDAKAKAIEAEMEKIKEAAISYAEREKVEVISGGGHKLTVKERQKVSCPSKKSPERKALEDVLHKEGKWDEVSTVDTFALADAVKKESWGKDFLKKIKGLVTIETRKQVTYSRLKARDD